MEILFHIFLGFIILVYVLDIVFLFYFGIHCYLMVWLYLKKPEACTTEAVDYDGLVKKMKKWPKVVVQLPMYNEYYVAERIIESACAIDYPKNLLEIQVLDDSTDESGPLAERKVQEYRKKGFNIHYIHRTNRQGHKAGALREAMDQTDAEFIAIFDADFLPAPEILKKSIPVFWENEKMGMVQSRWGHINADYSMLTRAQSIGIDGHFMIEQVARNANNLWMNFNGTAGIWRKDCILDSGNWQADTLTEDFDLSYRAMLRGWKFKYLSDIISPAEIPATVPAYKSQQFRWCKGSIQTAMKLIPRIWKSGESWKVKGEAITHLLNYSVHPLMIINILTTLPLLFFYDTWIEVSTTTLAAAVVILSVGTLGPMIFYVISQKTLYPDWKKRIKYLPLLTTIGTGIAINNTKAWIEAVIGKKSQFVRTPKLRLEKKSDNMDIRNKYTQIKIDKMAIWEFLMGCYIMFTLYVAYMSGKYLMIPFLWLYGTGFLYVAFFTVYDPLKKALAARKSLAASN